MEQQSEWKKSWKNSSDPTKQRKFRRNAPYHHRKKFVTAHLDESVQDRVGTRSLPVREGDEAEVMRGDWAGLSGRVEEIDYDRYKVYVDGIEREAVDGTDSRIALDPSNLKLVKLNLDDERRIKEELSEEDREEIQADVEEEEPEEEEEQEAEADEGEEDYEAEYDDLEEEDEGYEKEYEDEDDVEESEEETDEPDIEEEDNEAEEDEEDDEERGDS